MGSLMIRKNLKKSKALFTGLAILPMATMPLTFISATSCSCHNSQVKKVDGTDWEGRLAGSFIADDYDVDDTKQTITYKFGRSIHSYQLVIPNYVFYKDKKYKVLLGERCFANNISLQGSVELNDFIVEIPATCFFGCTSLIGVIFHSYPTSIGVAAFADCFLLTKIVVLKKDRIVYDWTTQLRVIDDYAFCNAQLKTDLVFTSNLVYIGQSAFERCTGITHVNMSNCINITSTSTSQFASCTMLTRVILPETIHWIADKTFRDCVNLISIVLPKDGMEIGIGDDAFYSCWSFKSFSRPVSFTSVGSGAFSMAERNEMHLWEPQYGLKEIRPHTFSSCGFSMLKFYRNGPDIQDYAFANNDQLTIIDFTDFLDEDGVFQLPKWTGKHIFAGANQKGGTIIFPSHVDIISPEWRTFFGENDIDISSQPSQEGGTSWSIVQLKKDITFVNEPSTHYFLFQDVAQSGQMEINLGDFTYESQESFDPDEDWKNLSVVFDPEITGAGTLEIIDTEIHWAENHKKFSIIVKVQYSIEKVKIGFMGDLVFKYDGRPVESDKQDFIVDLALPR